MSDVGETFLPPASGKAWEEAHAAFVRSTVAWVYRHAVDAEYSLGILKGQVEDDGTIEAMRAAVEQIRRWAALTVTALDIPDAEIPRNPHLGRERRSRR